MDETNKEASDIGTLMEQLERNQRILSQLLLAEEEQHAHHQSKHDQTNYLRRVPGKDVAPEIEAEKKHQCQPKDGDTSEPIDRFDALHGPGLGIVDVEEDEEDEEGQAGEGQVDPPVPAPGGEFREGAAKDGSDAAC